METKSFSDYLSLNKAFEVELLMLQGADKESMGPDWEPLNASMGPEHSSILESQFSVCKHILAQLETI